MASHSEAAIGAIWEKYDNIHSILNAKTLRVENGSIFYRQDGEEKTLGVDTIIVCGGMKPRMDEALRYSKSASRFVLVGDCNGVGNIQKCNREAFAASNQF